MDKKTKKIIKNTLKKANKATLLLVLLFLIIGIGAGVATNYLIVKNDRFEIIGDKEIILNVGDTYLELGANIIAFGNDVSDDLIIEGNVDTDIQGEYVLIYTTNNFRFKNVKRVRLVIVIAEGEDDE